MGIRKPPQPTRRQQSGPQRPTFRDGLKSVFSVCQTNASAVESAFDPPPIIVASKPPALFAVPKESEHGVEDVEEYDDCLYTPEEYDMHNIQNTEYRL